MSANNSCSEWYWLVGGGPMQVNALKYIQALGFKIILTDGDPDCIGKEYADLFFSIDTQDWQSHLKLKKVLQLQGVWENIKGVSCIATDSHYTVAWIANELNLPGLSPELSIEIGDKSKMRMNFRQMGAIQPSFIILDSKMDKNEINSRIFNFIYNVTTEEFFIKPIGFSASVGLMVCKKNEVKEFFRKVFLALEISRTSQIVVEEKLAWDHKFASEASIETLVLGGKVLFLNMVDRIFQHDLSLLDIEDLPTKLALGVEFGHVNPSIREPVEIKKIISILQEFVYQLKTRGVYKNETFILKADIFFSDKGPVVLESTPRTSGGWDSSYSSIRRGLNIQELAVDVSLGKNFTIPRGSQYFVAVVTNASESFKNNKGRKFYGGEPSHDILSAVHSALNSKKMGKEL